MRLLVIGGVAAGLSAAARARRLDASLDILVLEKSDVISYAACGLPYLVEGRVGSREDLIVYTPERFRRERNIDVRTHAEVHSIHHSARQVALAGGERVHYDRLVIATGARPDRRLPGAGQPHVFTLDSLAAAERLREFLRERKPRRAVVVGAGYIGLEAADALRTHGLSVTVFESSAFVLNRPCADLTEAVHKHLKQFHIDLRLSEPVREIEPNRVNDVPCDLVVLCAGLLPNVEIAAEAGIDLGRTGAIRVTDRMETNLTGVYAAGDCAETTHVVTGAPVYIPLGTTANKTGRVAGANAAGRRERFPGVAGTSIVRVCGLAIAMTGLSPAEAKKEGFHPVSAAIEARERPKYFWGRPTTVRLVADWATGRLLGGMVLGEAGAAGRINVLAAALTARMRLDEFEQLDLAYAPPYANVWDPLLICAQQLRRQL
jgi:NADPH-dependent 2,4-dienoyl-CoA reductase/sulfur reductase-like enzyme